MKWEKRGRILEPGGAAPWFASHAALPIAEHLGGDRFRLYFSGRDDQGRSRIGAASMIVNDGAIRVEHVSQDPVLQLGSLGAFDDNGVTSSCLVTHEGRRYLYYTGWTLGRTVPFYFYVGLAVSEGNAEFRRISAAPILERNVVDPYLTASPYVLIDGGTWRMWYVSCTEWRRDEGTVSHRYHIRYAESTDGIYWRRDGRVAIEYASPAEYALSRPSIVRDDDGYHMWFSHRGEAYRCGYAMSPDGLNWKRDDRESAIAVSATGWDSEMVAYPYVFDHLGIRYAIYNGNGYGATGIGYAVLKTKEHSC